MSKRIIYGIKEIQLVLQIFGESSSIYKAMVMGVPISNIVKLKMQESNSHNELMEQLLSLCVNKEKLYQDNDMCQ